jgi:diacylglycerol kinase family enzyme
MWLLQEREMANNETVVAVVLNPRSAGGNTAKRSDDIRASFEQAFDTVHWFETTSGGDGVRQGRCAAETGAGIVVAVGGDGTASEVVNGLMSSGVAPIPTFALLSSGTGGDLSRTLKMPSEIDAAVQAIAETQPHPTDLLSIEVGGEHHGWCVNVTGFGINGEVVRRANTGSKRFGAKPTFLMAIFKALSTYRPRATVVTFERADGSTGRWQGDLLAGFAANGQYCGGGLDVGKPDGIADGLIDLTIIPKSNARRIMRGMRHFYDGKLGTVEGIVQYSVRKVTVTAVGKEAVPVEVDGELGAALPLTVSVCEHAIMMIRSD